VTPRRLFFPIWAITLGIGLAGLPMASGQPAAPIPRLGFLALTEPSPVGEAFRRGLRELGYVEERTSPSISSGPMGATTDCRSWRRSSSA